MHNSHQTNAVGLEDLTFSISKCLADCRWIVRLTPFFRNIVRLRNIFKAWEDRLPLLMSSKPTRTHTPSRPLLSSQECNAGFDLIRVQIIMLHFFHIKKMSIIISIVLVKFLTVVRWMYKIPLERCHKYEHNACVTRVWHAIHCGNYSLASSHQKIRWICTHKASEINDCNLLWHPSLLYDK